MEWSVEDSDSGWKGERAACHGPAFLWDPGGVLNKGVRSSALEVLENQGTSGEISLVGWQGTGP